MCVSGKQARADRELVLVADQLDELVRVLQAALGLRPLGPGPAAGRRAARGRCRSRRRASASSVARSSSTVGVDAGEVRHRLEAVAPP